MADRRVRVPPLPRPDASPRDDPFSRPDRKGPQIHGLVGNSNGDGFEPALSNGITDLDGSATRKERLHNNAGTVRLQPHHCPIVFASKDEDLQRLTTRAS